MKKMILAALILLAIVVAVYLFTSLRNISRELVDPKVCPKRRLK